MFKIGLKLWSLNTDCYLKEAVRLYAEGVYDYIELYVVPHTLAALPQWEQLEIPYIIHHPHFAHQFNLSLKDKRDHNMVLYREVKQYADALDARHIIFHGGMNGSVDETIAQLQIIDDKRALIENKPYVTPIRSKPGMHDYCIGATVEDIEKITRETRCGFCMDVGHAVCSANYQKKDPYKYLQEFKALQPCMFHLSDVLDMKSIYDAHPHLGTGNLDIGRLKHELFPLDAMISVETDKNSKTHLDDFKDDCVWLRN